MPNTTWPEFTKVPAELWKHIQMNSGVVVTGFDPTDGSYESIIGATGGDVVFNPQPEFYDLGEGINNLPANTKQLLRIRGYNPQLSGTFKSVTTALATMLQAGAASSGTGIVRIKPSGILQLSDFKEIAMIGDFSEVNTGANAGFMAIVLHDALNRTGFQWTAKNRDKGDFPFQFNGHYDLDNLDQVPFDIYLKQGTAA